MSKTMRDQCHRPVVEIDNYGKRLQDRRGSLRLGSPRILASVVVNCSEVLATVLAMAVVLATHLCAFPTNVRSAPHCSHLMAKTCMGWRGGMRTHSEVLGTRRKVIAGSMGPNDPQGIFRAAKHACRRPPSSHDLPRRGASPSIPSKSAKYWPQNG